MWQRFWSEMLSSQIPSCSHTHPIRLSPPHCDTTIMSSEFSWVCLQDQSSTRYTSSRSVPEQNSSTLLDLCQQRLATSTSQLIWGQSCFARLLVFRLICLPLSLHQQSLLLSDCETVEQSSLIFSRVSWGAASYLACQEESLTTVSILLHNCPRLYNQPAAQSPTCSTQLTQLLCPCFCYVLF